MAANRPVCPTGASCRGTPERHLRDELLELLEIELAVLSGLALHQPLALRRLLLIVRVVHVHLPQRLEHLVDVQRAGAVLVELVGRPCRILASLRSAAASSPGPPSKRSRRPPWLVRCCLGWYKPLGRATAESSSSSSGRERPQEESTQRFWPSKVVLFWKVKRSTSIGLSITCYTAFLSLTPAYGAGASAAFFFPNGSFGALLLMPLRVEPPNEAAALPAAAAPAAPAAAACAPAPAAASPAPAAARPPPPGSPLVAAAAAAAAAARPNPTSYRRRPSSSSAAARPAAPQGPVERVGAIITLFSSCNAATRPRSFVTSACNPALSSSTCATRNDMFALVCDKLRRSALLVHPRAAPTPGPRWRGRANPNPPPPPPPSPPPHRCSLSPP